jgi:hypothetical protein
MHENSFDPPASALPQARSPQFIGRGVTIVAAARGFVLANIYYNQPSRQEGHLTRSQSSTVVVICLIGQHVAGAVATLLLAM